MKNSKIFYYLIFTLFLIYVSWSFYYNWHTLATFNWTFNIFDGILALIFLIPIYFINVLAWHFILKSLGEHIDYRVNLRIWTFSNLARFIPGSVFQYPSRIVLLKNQGVSRKNAIAGLVIEFSLNISVAIILIALFSLIDRNPSQINQKIYLGSIIVSLLIFIILLLLNNLRSTINIFLSRYQIFIPKISIKYMTYVVLLFLLLFMLGGCSFFFVSRNLIQLDVLLLPTFIEIYILSWLIGYLVIIAPGGLGVQEITMSTMLSRYMPMSVALVVVIVFRLFLYLSEFIALLLGVYLNKKK